MVPGFKEVMQAAKDSGAVGVCLSGAGPTMLSLVDCEKVKPQMVLKGMVKAFRANGAEAKGFVTSVGEGATLVESS